MNAAAGLQDGKRGVDVLMRPILDFEALMRVTVLRARGVLQNLPRMKSDIGAADEIATFAAAGHEPDNRTGFEVSTTLKAVQRIRKVLRQHPYRSPP